MRYAACTQPKPAVSTCTCVDGAAGGVFPSLFRLSQPSQGVTQAQFDVLEASLIGDLATLQRHLSSGMNVNILVTANSDRGDFDITTLMAATVAGRAEAVQLLLDHGADPNAQPCNLRSPLCIAAQNGDCSIVRMLLKAGACLVAGTKWKPEMPVIVAARAYWDALQQWSTEDPSGAFAMAEDYKRCFRLLLDAMALHISGLLEVRACCGLSGPSGGA